MSFVNTRLDNGLSPKRWQAIFQANVDLQKIVPLETNAIHDSNPKHQRFYGRNTFENQGWGEYYSGTRLAQNDKHEYTKNIVLEYYSSTDFPVLVLVCWVLAPALLKITSMKWRPSYNKDIELTFDWDLFIGIQ